MSVCLSYGELDWLDVDDCQGIVKHQCDLSSVTSDTREWYYARVHATSLSTGSKSAWVLSPRFSPRWDSECLHSRSSLSASSSLCAFASSKRMEQHTPGRTRDLKPTLMKLELSLQSPGNVLFVQTKGHINRTKNF